jgi:hypothetical protein
VRLFRVVWLAAPSAGRFALTGLLSVRRALADQVFEQDMKTGKLQR